MLKFINIKKGYKHLYTSSIHLLKLRVKNKSKNQNLSIKNDNFSC